MVMIQQASRRFARLTLCLALLLAACASFQAVPPTAIAEISITSLGAPYVQNFDTLANSGTSNPWTDDSTINGWYASLTTYNAGTGSSTGGGLYSFGTAASDRALGSLASGSTDTIHFGVRLANDTGATITSLTVSYTGEQWRNGGNATAHKLDVAYQVGATVASLTSGTWTDADALDFTGPVATASADALDGNLPAHRTAIAATLPVTINPGEEIMLRWSDANDSGSDHGLAIDDLTLTVSDKPPVVPVCPATLITSEGTATSAAVSASDADGIVTSAQIVSAPVAGITIDNFAPAGSNGGSASATLNVASTTALGSYNVVIQWANNDTSPQTATCTVVVRVQSPVQIRDIQGTTHISPLNGQSVSNVPGVVTAKSSNGFYMQDPNPDSDPATSEGLFVFTSSAPAVAVGDAVLVNGTVTEFRPGGSGGSNNLTITEISNPGLSVVVQSSGLPLPAPTVIGQGGRLPPTQVIEDDANGSVETSNTFDPDSDGIDFYESLEGMLVQVNNAVAVGPTNRFGEIPVLADNGANAGQRTARGGIVIAPEDFNPERIILDDALTPNPPQMNVSDRFAGAIVGVMDYSFGNFKLLSSGPWPSVISGGLTREATNLTANGNQLTVASFNVENLSPNDSAAKFNALASLIVDNLKSPDIIGLEEVQDNNGATNDDVVSADQTLNQLIAAIQSAGGPDYEYRQINPVDDQDGGQPGGNIRVAFLFNPKRATFVDRPGGTSTASTTVIAGDKGPELSFSPGRIDPTNPAFANSRKPLAGEFVANGRTLFVIVNHFNSKGGDQPLFGRFQPPKLNSEEQRTQQAQVVNDFVDAIVALDSNANIIVLGDLNDFEFSKPLEVLKGDVLHDLVDLLPKPERYTYVFDGNSQVLDHILVSNNMFDNGEPQYDVVHVNAEFADQTSDHDPEVALFALNKLLPQPAPEASIWLPLIKGTSAGSAE